MKHSEKMLVSIIVPAFNAANSITRCLDSIFSQTYANFEVIVVDDGSEDDTPEILGTYPNQIQVVRQTNAGETAARNAGFKRAAGELITFIDHDDYWEPEFVASCVNFLDSHPDASVVSVGSSHVSALTDKVTVMPVNLERFSNAQAEGLVIDDFFDFWVENNHVCAGSAMIRASLIEESNGQRADLYLSGDLEYWALLGSLGTWGFIPKVLLHIDGTQARASGLFNKYYERYCLCTTVEDWQSRIISLLPTPIPEAFLRIRGRIATWYIFAHVFVGDDDEAYRMACCYRQWLEGRYGTLWWLACHFGKIGWKAMCKVVRMRLRYQYSK